MSGIHGGVDDGRSELEGLDHKPVAKTSRLLSFLKLTRFADPPHPLTLLVLVTGPLVAMAALWLSYQSYLVSRQAAQTAVQSADAARVSATATKVNQRANLYIKNQRLHFYPDFMSRPRVSELTKVEAITTFDVFNDGNTEAEITHVTASYKIPILWSSMPLSGPPYSREEEIVETSPRGTLPGKAKYQFFQQEWFYLTPDNANAFRALLIHPKVIHGGIEVSKRDFTVKGFIEYRDVFSDMHRLNWCLQTFVGLNTLGLCDEVLEWPRSAPIQKP